MIDAMPCRNFHHEGTKITKERKELKRNRKSLFELRALRVLWSARISLADLIL
jgi:hypothetical protein